MWCEHRYLLKDWEEVEAGVYGVLEFYKNVHGVRYKWVKNKRSCEQKGLRVEVGVNVRHSKMPSGKTIV